MPTGLEASSVGESQSNGFIERAVRSLDEMIRTRKIALGALLGVKVNVAHPATGWLIEHGPDILNRCQVGKDGRTPYECLHGEKFGGTFLEFGNLAMPRVTEKPQGGFIQKRWIETTWLGSRFNMEHVASRRSFADVLCTRAVREVPRPAQESDLDDIIGKLHAPQGVQRLRESGGFASVGNTSNKASTASLNFRFLQDSAPCRVHVMLEKHGYTANCVKCRALE